MNTVGNQVAVSDSQKGVGNWEAVGRAIRKARLGPPRTAVRVVAQKAGVSPSWWVSLEKGRQQVKSGLWVPINPSDDNLRAAALAVRLDPAEVFAMAGRDYRPSDDDEADRVAALTRQVAALEERVSQLVALIEERLPPPHPEPGADE